MQQHLCNDFLILLFAPPPFSSGLGTGNGGVNKHITTQRPSRSSSDSPGLNRHSGTALGSGGQTYTSQHNTLHCHRAIHLALIGIQEPPSDQGDKYITYTNNETRHIYIFFTGLGLILLERQD